MWGLCHCGSNSWLLLRGRDRDPEGGRAVDHRLIDPRAPDRGFIRIIFNVSQRLGIGTTKPTAT